VIGEKEDWHVEVVGHAALRVRSGRQTLLTDPWLIDPIVCNSSFHYPPLVHDPASLAAETDAIYISHIHPDHFHPPSLQLFSRATPIYIGAYRRKRFRDALRGLGFQVIEVPFQKAMRVDGTDFEITLIEHDSDESAPYDSAILIRTPDFTVFENNDCFLRREKYIWTRDRHEIDYAFLGYSPASPFPISFEMDAREKERLLSQAAERRYDDFVEAAEILGAKLAVPFANGLRFLLASALWKNVAFNSATEAARRLSNRRGEVMGPGDRILADGSVSRRSPVLEREQELAAIAAHAQSVQDRVARLAGQQAALMPELIERFRDHVLHRWRRMKHKLPGVRGSVITYRLIGAPQSSVYFDFSRPDAEIFQRGEPASYDMRYTYPAAVLQAWLAGDIDWDQMNFTNDVSVHQVNYARDFCTLLRSEIEDLG
jgi:L-ascorbate metabolism protein UlaG (beta-lactamase superfamily)